MEVFPLLTPFEARFYPVLWPDPRGNAAATMTPRRASGGTWQTRRIQVPVRATSWGFNSPLAHVRRSGWSACIGLDLDDHVAGPPGVQIARPRRLVANRDRHDELAPVARSALNVDGPAQVIEQVANE